MQDRTSSGEIKKYAELLDRVKKEIAKVVIGGTKCPARCLKKDVLHKGDRI